MKKNSGSGSSCDFHGSEGFGPDVQALRDVGQKKMKAWNEHTAPITDDGQRPDDGPEDDARHGLDDETNERDDAEDV